MKQKQAYNPPKADSLQLQAEHFLCQSQEINNTIYFVDMKETVVDEWLDVL
jgi:hypothetical protein